MNAHDVYFYRDGFRFNFRVSCVISQKGKYLLHRRTGDVFWNLIGGKPTLGESSVDAIRREIWEELGCDCEIDGLASLGENFFHYMDTEFHEILMIFRGTLMEPIREENLEEDLEIRWFLPEELDQIEIRPAYSRDIILEPERRIRWIVDDERK